MTDPKHQGGRKAARINYVAADHCYRETCLSLTEAQAMTIRSPYDTTFVEAAQQLLIASSQHQQTAADALTEPAANCSRLNSPEQKATAHSRLTIQLAVQALILLNSVSDTRNAKERLDFYLPSTRGNKYLKADQTGEPLLSNTPTIFGTNRNGPTPARPHHVAMLDITLNHLVQQTRNWPFSTTNARDFCREFLEHAQQGNILDEDKSNAWINRRLAQTEAGNTQLVLQR